MTDWQAWQAAMQAQVLIGFEILAGIVGAFVLLGLALYLLNGREADEDE